MSTLHSIIIIYGPELMTQQSRDVQSARGVFNDFHFYIVSTHASTYKKKNTIEVYERRLVSTIGGEQRGARSIRRCIDLFVLIERSKDGRVDVRCKR